MQKAQLTTAIAVAAGIAIVALFFFIGPGMFSPTISSSTTQGAIAADAPMAKLIVQDELVGHGAQAQVGDMVTVNYIGKLQDGGVFDTSIGKEPFSFTIGAGKVIPGWEQGVLGMKVGGKRLLIIPPQLAYGNQQLGPIPPNATLVFEISLLSVTPPAVAQ